MIYQQDRTKQKRQQQRLPKELFAILGSSLIETITISRINRLDCRRSSPLYLSPHPYNKKQYSEPRQKIQQHQQLPKKSCPISLCRSDPNKKKQQRLPKKIFALIAPLLGGGHNNQDQTSLVNTGEYAGEHSVLGPVAGSVYNISPPVTEQVH